MLILTLSDVPYYAYYNSETATSNDSDGLDDSSASYLNYGYLVIYTAGFTTCGLSE
jgi:hypothetical protein